MARGNRMCKCGAIYRRTEAVIEAREIDCFACEVCGVTLESWNSAYVPTYRLVVGPVRSPDQS
jgi:hypothetical protein